MKLSTLLTCLLITSLSAQENWVIDSAKDWKNATAEQENLVIKDGMASPTAKAATFRSKLQRFDQKRAAQSLTIDQSPIWQNWSRTKKVGPPNLGGAPITLQMAPDNYWMFGSKRNSRKNKPHTPLPAKLEGFDIPLVTTPYSNLFIAPGGLKNNQGGYHGWQSRDMINWVYHGPVTPPHANWATTAEMVDGKVYLYYDYPNDQDPHLIIDDNLTDGLPGKDMGMAFLDPSDGSDSAIIRDLDGKFHLIQEDWSPIDPSTHAWDSPLAMRATSEDGIKDFKIQSPPVDERTKPTGKFAEYFHPHWHLSTRKDEFPAKPVPANIPQHRLKKGDVRSFAKYEIHEPEQNAYGDWAAISIGGQYYLFCDFDPTTEHGKEGMSVAWFTSSSLGEKFTFCDNIGKGHPDPDIIFAEGKFYLATQTPQSFISPGPWVNGVEVRVGIDTTNDGTINQWTDWSTVKETYRSIPGFAKQVAKTPAQLDLSKLPAAFGYQFEVKLSDTTENKSKPILDKITLSFSK